MKYYSERLNKLFDTEKELVEAEEAAEKLRAEKNAKKAEKAKIDAEIADARKALKEAEKKCNDALKTAAELKEKVEKETQALVLGAQGELDVAQAKLDALLRKSEKHTNQDQEKEDKELELIDYINFYLDLIS